MEQVNNPLEDLRVVETQTSYHMRTQTTRVHLKLANGQRVDFNVADFVQESLGILSNTQGFVWAREMNRRLGSGAVKMVRTHGPDTAIVVLRNGMELAGPTKELFSKETLATIVLLEASYGPDARG